MRKVPVPLVALCCHTINSNDCWRLKACALTKPDAATSKRSYGSRKIRSLRMKAPEKEQACLRESRPLRRQNDELRSCSKSSLCSQSATLLCLSSDGDYGFRTTELSPGAKPRCGKRHRCAFAERLRNPRRNHPNNRGRQYYTLVQTLRTNSLGCDRYHDSTFDRTRS